MLVSFLIAVALSLYLPSETENAGLNVTCACRVFLLESVVHHSFEIQGKSDLLSCLGSFFIFVQLLPELIGWDKPAQQKVGISYFLSSTFL